MTEGSKVGVAIKGSYRLLARLKIRLNNIKGENKMKYRKKPVEIEAIKLPDSLFDIDGCVFADEWFVKNQGDRKCRWVGDSVIIPTLEGEMKANMGDYIIKGIKGEIYPCKPDIFEATYEKV